MRRERPSRWWLLPLATIAVFGCDPSRTLPGGDSSLDSAPVDLPRGREQVLRDSSADIDRTFPAVLEGVWLVGWSDKMHHFSWVRFARMAARTSLVKHDAWILAGDDIVANVPLWSCSGKTTYWMGAAGNTIYLDFPSTSCLGDGKLTEGYVFGDFTAPTSGPKGAILSVPIHLQATLKPMTGYKFPDSWCDASMTSCASPFQ